MQDRIHPLVADRTQALAAVSHDLRTPLTRLRLRAGFVADDEAQRAMDGDLDGMEAMIEATLHYLQGGTEAGDPRRTDIAAMLATVVDDAADAGHDAAFAGPRHLPRMLSPLPVKRALSNLVNNAINHGGSARVLLEPVPDGVRVEGGTIRLRNREGGGLAAGVFLPDLSRAERVSSHVGKAP